METKNKHTGKFMIAYDTLCEGWQCAKDEDENPKSKYFDNKLLPIIIESGGKRRTKTKKRKTKKRNERIYKK